MIRGFSLLESLFLLAIITSVGVVAGPALSRWSAHRAVTFETESVRLMLEEAFLAALAYNRTVTAHIKGRELRVSYEEDELLFSHTVRKDIGINLKSSEIEKLTFYPTHTATPATVLIKGRTRTCSIIISLRGRMRSECV